MASSGCTLSVFEFHWRCSQHRSNSKSRLCHEALQSPSECCLRHSSARPSSAFVACSRSIPGSTTALNLLLPDTVMYLQLSMRDLEAAVMTFSKRKSVSSKTKENARLLVTAGNRVGSAITAACALRPGDLHILAKSYITVTRESVEEWTGVLQERGTSSVLQSFKLRTDTASQVEGFALAMQILEKMLAIENGIAGLVLDPARHLHLSDVKPTSDLPRLSNSRFVYEGFKVVAKGLANLTEGAPWPWKAIPQIVLQFTSMVESALVQPQRIHDLSDKIARRIAFLLSVSQSKGGSSSELDTCVESFLLMCNGSSYASASSKEFILQRHSISPITSTRS
ncbi:hypothetical protein BKA62DRAFT_122677 [Auriculariales sp. MPI-PUGE-AT-0066]|nr:hypothetical protein BKA62DRAFT_122677 [Auriculariales sp. MPI-PUGE-AT-0066]